MFHLLGTKEERKGSGNNHCGKTGHKAAECWAKQGQKGHAPSYSKGMYGKGLGNTNMNTNPNTSSSSGKAGKGSKGGQKGSKGKNALNGKKGKGSGKKGKSKGVNNVEEGEAAQETHGDEQSWDHEDWAERNEAWEEQWAEGRMVTYHPDSGLVRFSDLRSRPATL